MNKIYTLLIILVLGCVSCGDFLEEDSQTLSYVTSVEDLDELLVGSGYLQNARGTYYTMSWLEVMDDDMQQKLTGSHAALVNFVYVAPFSNGQTILGTTITRIGLVEIKRGLDCTNQ
ncbi:MAG: hypothetical protein ACLTZT_02530 [Butyricimonas faecalis]